MELPLLLDIATDFDNTPRSNRREGQFFHDRSTPRALRVRRPHHSSPSTEIARALNRIRPFVSAVVESPDVITIEKSPLYAETGKLLRRVIRERLNDVGMHGKWPSSEHRTISKEAA